MDSSFSSSAKTKTKLSVRNQTRFKKSSFSSTKKTNISMREQTMFNKSYELSTLCDIQACVLYYGRDGELIKTWPEDQSKVRDMAERFSKLSDNEKRKKSTNLSQFLNKKMNDEKKRSLDKNDNKFSDKVLEMEHSLETRLRIFQDKLRRLLQTEQNHNFTDSSGFFSADLSPMILSTSLIDDQSLAADSSGFTTHLSPSLFDDPHHQQWTEESLTNHHLSGGFATDSLNHHQSKFSIFLYNHDNGSFSQLADSVSSFDQATAPYNMVIPPQMQTQNPLLHYDQFAAWNQTPSFGVQ